MKEQDIIYFSGIILAILDATSRENLFSSLKLARHAGTKIAFDPNIRPKLWTYRNEMCEVIMAGANLSNIILPSFEDEAAWFSDTNPSSTLDRYRNVGKWRQ